MAPKTTKPEVKPPESLGEEEFPEVEAPPEEVGAAAPAEEAEVDLNVDEEEEDVAPPAPPPPPPPVEPKATKKPARRGAITPTPAPAVKTDNETRLELENRLLRDELAKVNHSLKMAEKRSKGQGGLMEFSNHTPESARAARAAKHGRPGQYKTLKQIKNDAKEHSRRQSKAQKDIGNFVKNLASLSQPGRA